MAQAVRGPLARQAVNAAPVTGGGRSGLAVTGGVVEVRMRGLAAAVIAVLASTGCACAGADPDARGPVPTTASPGTLAQAAAAALAFAAHSDPEVAVVDGYATLPPAVQRGERPIDPADGHRNPCAR